MSEQDLASALISALEDLDMAARNAMVNELSDRPSEVTEYILQQQEELGEELEDLLVDVSGDVQVDVIRSLQLMSMTILADEHGGTAPFAA